MLQRLLKLLKLANPKYVNPALPVPFYSKHNTRSRPQFPPPPASWPTWNFLRRPPPTPALTVSMSLSLSVCEYNTLLLQCQASPDLFYLPYLNNDKIYIVKHPISLTEQRVNPLGSGDNVIHSLCSTLIHNASHTIKNNEAGKSNLHSINFKINNSLDGINRHRRRKNE